MERERVTRIQNAITILSARWLNIGENPPSFSVKEVSRISNINPSTLVNTLMRKKITIEPDSDRKILSLNLTDIEGNRVRSPTISALKSAPYKRAVRKSAYRSRAPGGGPVVKRRIDEDDLKTKMIELGKGRLKIVFDEMLPEDERTKERRLTKKRLAKRWAQRSESNIEISKEAKIIQQQVQILKEVGLWTTPELFGKYSFRLSPDVLELAQSQEDELKEVSNLMFCPGGFLDGSLKLFRMSSNPQFLGNSVGGAIRRILTTGISKRELSYLDALSLQPPFICRLDLVLNKKQNPSEPSFQIVEIEGDKTHGFGYVSIADGFRKLFFGRSDTVGIVSSLEKELERRDVDKNEEIILIVGGSEMFYIKELQIFADLARQKGINLTTITEDKLTRKMKDVLDKVNSSQRPVFINIPSLIPVNYSVVSPVVERLFEMFQRRQVEVLIPPSRFLGSKGLLGLFRNGEDDPQIESVLESVFDRQVLAKLRRFIPPTVVVTKRNIPFAAKILGQEKDNFVIKKVMASGMRGVALPDDKDKQKDFIESALNRPYNFVIQRKVNQETRLFSFSDPKDLKTVREAYMFLRVSLFATKNGVATIGVTARETPDVHGSKDSIQIPVIFG